MRTGPVRALCLSLGAIVLLLPVGVETASGVDRLSIPDAVAYLASGHIGASLLGGLVAGGAATREGFYRLVIALVALFAYAVAGLIRPTVQDAGPKGRIRCPSCRSVMSRKMAYCPACGGEVRPK